MINQKKFKQNKLKKQHFIDNRVIPLPIPGQYICFLKISVISGNVNFFLIFFYCQFFFQMRKKHTKVLLRKIKNNKKKLRVIQERIDKRRSVLPVCCLHKRVAE